MKNATFCMFYCTPQIAIDLCNKIKKAQEVLRTSASEAGS